MPWDAIEAIATVVAAVMSAVAAGVACYTARQAKQIAERQTGIGAVQDLAEYYAGQEMYDALKSVGEIFIKHNDVKNSVSILFRDKYYSFGEEIIDKKSKEIYDDNLKRGVYLLYGCEQINAARRRIHHFYKSVWRLSELGALKDRSLELLTIETTGWPLWRDSILPITWAEALKRQAEEHDFALPKWGNYLIKRVDC
jgi:hypothetical protein